MRERIVSEVAERELRNLRIERSDRKVIDVAAIPLPDGGRLYKYTDVTDSINMERALRERNEALMAADRLKSEFIANVSYEFRTPLNAIIGYAELLSRQYFGTLNEKQQEYSHGILDAAQALLLLISDVIDVAAIEAGYIKLDLKPIDVKDMLEASERLFQQRARMRSVALSLDTASELGEIVGDQQRLKQALSNLLSNALSAAPYGGDRHPARQAPAAAARPRGRGQQRPRRRGNAEWIPACCRPRSAAPPARAATSPAASASRWCARWWNCMAAGSRPRSASAIAASSAPCRSTPPAMRRRRASDSSRTLHIFGNSLSVMARRETQPSTSLLSSDRCKLAITGISTLRVGPVMTKGICAGTRDERYALPR